MNLGGIGGKLAGYITSSGSKFSSQINSVKSVVGTVINGGSIEGLVKSELGNRIGSITTDMPSFDMSSQMSEMTKGVDMPPEMQGEITKSMGSFEMPELDLKSMIK